MDRDMSNPLPPEPDPDALENARWFKARRSNSGGCVEVAHVDRNWTGIRDSKQLNGPVHLFTKSAFTTFIEAAKNGEFDRR